MAPTTFAILSLTFPLQVFKTKYVAPVSTKKSTFSVPSFIITRGSAGALASGSLHSPRVIILAAPCLILGHSVRQCPSSLQ